MCCETTDAHARFTVTCDGSEYFNRSCDRVSPVTVAVPATVAALASVVARKSTTDRHPWRCGHTQQSQSCSALNQLQLGSLAVAIDKDDEIKSDEQRNRQQWSDWKRNSEDQSDLQVKGDHGRVHQDANDTPCFATRERI